jgi:AAT family amino acid transporter
MSVESKTDNKFSYLFGIINFVVVFVIVWVLWYFFMHPNGIMKLYTPMYGFSLVAMFLSAVVLISKVVDYHPFGEGPAEGNTRIIRGAVLTAVALVVALFAVYIVFWNFIGKYGVAYFSPDSIVKSGGTGAEPLVARENACTAIVYFTTAFLWWALTWNLGFGRWPWIGVNRGVMAWSRFFAVLIFSILTYVVLFHPHVCYLFYPPQNKAGVEPWWSAFAGTGSAYFSLGLILCTLAWVIVSDLLWEGYPWKWLEKNGQGTFIKGLVTFIVTLILGVVIFVPLLKIMNYFWFEPFEGGQYTDAPYFRYLHTGEISGFIILAAFIWSTYFNKFPNTRSLGLNALVRTVIAVAGGLAIYLFYYSTAATYTLGKVPGIAQPDDTPLVWTMLFLSIIMVQTEFFDGWPLSVRKETAGSKNQSFKAAA